MNYCEKLEIEAAEGLKKILSKPVNEFGAPSTDEFDPWEGFQLYGSYSSEFDNVALTVLENLSHQGFEGESLAHEMFREMLCKRDLCDYGTSPRVCFPTEQFKEMLPEYIDKWKKYYKAQWGEDWGK